MKTHQGTRLLAGVVFVAATLVLAVQLINPTPVQVTVGDDGSQVVELSNQFRYRDVGVVAVAACLLGSSGTYLVTSAIRDRTRRSAPTDRPRVLNRKSAGRSGANDRRSDPTPPAELVESKRNELDAIADRLTENEEAVYTRLLDADGEIKQRRLVDETDLSGATVSRTLDSLETKNFVERKRRGMGNVVVLRELA